MDKGKFEEWMDRWASLEKEAAPGISPDERVYRELEKKRRKKKAGRLIFPVPWRWATGGIAAAAVFALIAVFLFRQPGGEVPPVGIRKGPAARIMEEEKGLEVTGKGKELEEAPPAEEPRTAPGPVGGIKSLALKPEAAAVARKETAGREDKEGKEKELAARAEAETLFGHVVLEYMRKDTNLAQERDLLVTGREALNLAPEDLFRVHVELKETRYVSLFQVHADRQVTRLFPSPGHKAPLTPLEPYTPYIFPPSPDWFFLGPEQGEETLVILASDRPPDELMGLYAEYSAASKGKKKQEIAARLIESLFEAEKEEGTTVLRFEFKVF